MDGVFETYDFPGSQKTHFYALGNDGIAAGHYMDKRRSVPWRHLRKWTAAAVRFFQTPSRRKSTDSATATGNLTGNFTDAEGVRRGFTGQEILEFPGTAETSADFVDSRGIVESAAIWTLKACINRICASPPGRVCAFPFRRCRPGILFSSRPQRRRGFWLRGPNLKAASR